jgi:hypothetical protein
MGTQLWSLRSAVLASAVAFAGVTPAAAVPAFVPPEVQSDIIQIQSSVIIRRDNPEHDGGAWKKRRHHREGREHSRGHARHRDDGARKFRPRATPKYAYDAYGNYRTYDGDGWDGNGHWDGWGDNKRKHRPRIYKRHSFDFQGPSPALQNILTAVPD